MFIVGVSRRRGPDLLVSRLLGAAGRCRYACVAMPSRDERTRGLCTLCYGSDGHAGMAGAGGGAFVSGPLVVEM